MSARQEQIAEPRTSDAERENFAVKLTDQCKTHSEWLAVVRYGLGSLLQNQPLLIEIIVREAERERERSGVKSYVAADYARAIFQELGLRFEV